MKTLKCKSIAALLIAIVLIACEKEDNLVKNPPNYPDSNGGLYDLYIYNISSNTNTRITNTPFKLESSYSFSPDSKKILFNTEGGTFTMNVDGFKITSLNAVLMTPAWSPDGKKIVFVESGNLFLVNSDGAGKHQLTHNDYSLWMPVWSSDGQKIACSSDNGLCIVTSDGTTESITTENSATWYDWSPDSKNLVYSKYVSINSAQIFKYNTEQKHEDQLTYIDKYNYDPFWKPKGDEIIFTSSHADYGSDLILMSSDGSQQQTVEHKNRISFPCWSPDGTQIAFINEDSNLALIDIDGNNYKIINDIPGACMNPVWSPDGKYILYYRAIFYN